jgi:hypothetical protein
MSGSLRAVRLSPALWCGLLAALAGTARADAPEPIRYENASYVAAVTPATGGLLDSLLCKATGEALVAGSVFYTDYGIYAERGNIRASADGLAALTARQEGDDLVVTAEGRLIGPPAEGQPPLRYRAETRFGRSETIHVAITLTPGIDHKAAAGFLALAWQVPDMVRWQIRTVDGLLRHTYHQGEETSRAYSREIPLDPVRPLIAVATKGGAELRVENLKWSGTPAFTGPVIHARTLFLCWLDGEPRDVVAGQQSTLEFDLVVVPPAP